MAEGEIVENGMFYFARRQLLEEGLFQVGNKRKHCKKSSFKQCQGGHCGYVEVPAEYSVEIDTPFDLAFAEQVAGPRFG